MKEQIVAKTYAASLYQLGEENKIDIPKELELIQQLITSCNDLENLLYLEIFAPDEKKNVFSSILSKIDISSLMKNFIFFLMDEKRIQLFPFIYKEATLIDDHKRGFISAQIEGVEDGITDDELELVKSYLRSKVGLEPQLQYKKNDKLTAGFRINAEDLQLDASIDRQFEIFKNSILGE